MPKLGYLFTRNGWHDKVYREGAILVHYIAETRGKRKIGKFAEFLSRGFSQTESLKKITGESTLKAINSDFIAWVQNQRE